MTMPTLHRPPIPAIVSQHVEEAAHLRHVRSVLVRAPHVKLHQLGRLDERIAAHLDGIAVAGDFGLRLCRQALESPTAGPVFALAVQALESRDEATLQRLFALAAAEPAAERGLLSAFGWVPADALRGTIRDLLASGDALRRATGLAACAMHRVDPGAALLAGLGAEDERLRLRALRVAGEVGRQDVLPQVEAALQLALQTGSAATSASDPASAAALFWSARSALLLGQRGVALDALANLAEGVGPHSDAAATWALKALDLERARAHLRHWAARSRETTPAAAMARRRLIQRCGVVGDPHVIPWLIQQMADLSVSRLAGEAFTAITGADLAGLDLERKPPEDAGDGRYGGPTEDPADDHVALDEDESLPWPDAARVQGWWEQHQGNFPAGQRFFLGPPPSPAHALTVLREGMQRQRTDAAQWRALLAPGEQALFPTAAPTRRQQRWLQATAH
jgi:uncharacterized protein (TIGR02270 family)